MGLLLFSPLLQLFPVHRGVKRDICGVQRKFSDKNHRPAAERMASIPRF